MCPHCVSRGRPPSPKPRMAPTWASAPSSAAPLLRAPAGLRFCQEESQASHRKGLRRNPGPRFVGRAPAAGRLLGAQGARGVQAPVSFPPAPRLSQNAASQGTRVPSSLPRFSEKMAFPGSISFPSPSWRCCGSPGQPRPESGLGHLQIWWELWGQLAAPDRGLETLIG